MEGNTKEMAYEKAIDGYQFLVNRYHTWMNYYSIFTGAFFIALYTVWDKGDAAQSACCKCCKAAAAASDDFWPYLLIVLGWIASVCWLASLIGHRAWMGSWIQVVKKWEKSVLGEPSKEPWSSVYGKIVTPNTLNTTPQYLPGFISTQKVTTGFVCAVILAWELMFCYLLLDGELNSKLVVGGIISLAVVLLIKQILRKCCCCLISDDLTDMIQ